MTSRGVLTDVPEPSEPEAVVDDLPGPISRAVLVVFLAVLLLTPLANVEEWPLTSWHLFAGLRTDTVYGWQVTTVDADGVERPIDFTELPRGFRGGFHIAAGLRDRPHAEAVAICRDWGRAVETSGIDVREVHVYRTNAKVVRPGSPRPPTVRIPRFDCDLP